MTHHRQVVGNEHVGGIEFLLQVHEQVQHLGLNRHVQCRGGLVRHQHFGLQHHRPRQGDTLTLATGKHVRVALVVLGAQTDLSHHCLHLLTAFRCRQFGVDQQRLAELVTNFLAWVE